MEDLSALEEIRVSGSSATASAVGEWLLTSTSIVDETQRQWKKNICSIELELKSEFSNEGS